MAETCPSQLSLCWACGCPMGWDNILLKLLYVQELNVWLSPRREYLLSCLCTSFQSPVSVPVCDDTISHNQGEDSLFQELLSRPASPLGVPMQGWRLQAVVLSSWGLCAVAVLRLSHGALLCPKKQQKGLGTQLTSHEWDLTHPYAGG